MNGPQHTAGRPLKAPGNKDAAATAPQRRTFSAPPARGGDRVEGTSLQAAGKREEAHRQRDGLQDVWSFRGDNSHQESQGKFYRNTFMYVSPAVSVGAALPAPVHAENIPKTARTVSSSPQVFQTAEARETKVANVSTPNKLSTSREVLVASTTQDRETQSSANTTSRSKPGKHDAIRHSERPVSDGNYIPDRRNPDVTIQRSHEASPRPNSIYFSTSQDAVVAPSPLNEAPTPRPTPGATPRSTPRPTPKEPRQGGHKTFVVPTTTFVPPVYEDDDDISNDDSHAVQNGYTRALEMTLPLAPTKSSFSSGKKDFLLADGSSRAGGSCPAFASTSAFDGVLPRGAMAGADEYDSTAFWKRKFRLHTPQMRGRDMLVNSSGWEVLRQIRHVLNMRHASIK